MAGLHPLVPKTVGWHNAAPEIILEVLENFLPFSMDVLKPSSFPWYLGQICGSWRSIFVSSPIFWRTFTINFRIRGKVKSYRIYQTMFLTKVCIERSKNRPLDFSLILSRRALKTDFEEYINVEPICDEMLEALIAVSTRWRDVYLDIRQVERLYATKGQLPMLRSIKLRYDDQCEPHAFRDLFEDAPQLRRVSFATFGIWSLNLSRLTTVHMELLQFYEPKNLIKYLQQLPQLRELFIRDDTVAFRSFTPTQAVTLPFLEVLCCRAELFPLFENPILEELCIQNRLGQSTCHELLENFLQKPMHCLRKLVLFSVNLDNAIHAVKYFPNLRHLAVCTVDLALFKVLGVGSAAPYLEILEVGVEGITMSWGEFLWNISRTTVFCKVQLSGAVTGPGPFTALKKFSLQVPGRFPIEREILLIAEKILMDYFYGTDTQVEVQRFDWEAGSLMPEFCSSIA